MKYDKSVQAELEARLEQDKPLPKGKVSRTHKIKKMKIKICKFFAN